MAARRDEPGPPTDIERTLREHAKRKRPLIGPLDPHLYVTFGPEVRAFLQRKGIHLVGDRLHSFIRSYVEAKELAGQELLQNAKKDYTPNDKVAARFPDYKPPHPAKKFDVLWAEFVEAKGRLEMGSLESRRDGSADDFSPFDLQRTRLDCS